MPHSTGTGGGCKLEVFLAHSQSFCSTPCGGWCGMNRAAQPARDTRMEPSRCEPAILAACSSPPSHSMSVAHASQCHASGGRERGGNQLSDSRSSKTRSRWSRERVVGEWEWVVVGHSSDGGVQRASKELCALTQPCPPLLFAGPLLLLVASLLSSRWPDSVAPHFEGDRDAETGTEEVSDGCWCRLDSSSAIVEREDHSLAVRIGEWREGGWTRPCSQPSNSTAGWPQHLCRVIGAGMWLGCGRR